MKSLLLLLVAAAAPGLALAQMEVPAGPAAAPAVAPASAQPAASAAPTPASTGPAHDAAAGVPLPGQSSGPDLEKTVPLMQGAEPSGGGRHSHSRKGAAGASPAEFATFLTEDDIRARVRLRTAMTQVLNYPDIQATWAAAHSARTDPKRRALLSEYYTHLYDDVSKLDPTDAQRAMTRRNNMIGRMKYTRLGDEDNSQNPFIPAAEEPSGPNPPLSVNTETPPQ